MIRDYHPHMPALQVWDTQANIFMEAFALYKIDGLSSGGYCCSWFGTLLEAQMWQQGFGCSTRRTIEMSAKKLLKLGYKVSPHFFAMTACLHAPRTAREEAMKEAQEKLSRGSSTPVERDSSGAQHHD